MPTPFLEAIAPSRGECLVKVYLPGILLWPCGMGAFGACVCDRSVCVEATCTCAELGTAPGLCQYIVESYDCRFTANSFLGKYAITLCTTLMISLLSISLK